MTLRDISKLPVYKLAAKDAVLFLWATFPLLLNALEVIEAWGFEYKTIGFLWVKTNRNRFTLFWGMGNWSRSNSEPCLLATRGNPKRISAGVHSVVVRQRMQHSNKPPEVRHQIVKLCGDKPRIELFATERCSGWASIGNEIDGESIQDKFARWRL